MQNFIYIGFNTFKIRQIMCSIEMNLCPGSYEPYAKWNMFISVISFFFLLHAACRCLVNTKIVSYWTDMSQFATGTPKISNRITNSVFFYVSFIARRAV